MFGSPQSPPLHDCMLRRSLVRVPDNSCETRGISMQTTAKLCVALGVIAAAIGRLAVDATAANMDVEAETFSLPSNSGQVYADSAASGGQALLIWSNATASKQVSTPSFTQLQVRARGDQCKGAPKMTVAANGKLVTLVAYNIPQRDCGGFSGGGTTADGYRSWIRAFADGIGSRQAIVVIEPDALANMTCLSEADQSTRLSLLSDAVSVLKSKPATSAYLDAGHSAWLTPSEAARRLNMANVSQANGFSLNVSNFRTTPESVNYGNQVSAQTGGKHFIVDTSRNGLGPTSDNQWCNPPGRALGDRPTLTTGQPLADAYLWVKRPGESDGQCNGGPPAGQWWADYALRLAQRAAY